MDSDTSLMRTFGVGVAMCCDIICNYPLWIAAKRIGANLSPFPTDIKHIYKGGGALWLSLGPTTMVEDKVTSILNHAMNDQQHHWYQGLLSAATSGMVAALLVASQVEYLITASHAEATPISTTVYSLYSRHGAQHLLLPPGMLAMVGREVPFASALFFVQPMMFNYMHTGVAGAGKGVEPSNTDTGNLSLQKLSTSALCGVLTSMLVTPISQAPSVIAAYQQGHRASVPEAVQDIRRRYGWRGFFRGLGARTFSLAGTFTVVPLVLERLDNVLGDES